MDNVVTAPGQAALDALRAREPFAAILVYDPDARATALDAALAGLQQMGAHIVRVGNPLRSPLTMERVLIQLAGFQTDLRQGEDTDTLMRTVIGQLQRSHKRLVVSVEQAETLQPMALILLDQIARSLEPGGPAPQILLTGTPAFTRVLGHPLLDRMRASLQMGTPDPPTPPARLPGSEPAGRSPLSDATGMADTGVHNTGVADTPVPATGGPDPAKPAAAAQTAAAVRRPPAPATTGPVRRRPPTAHQVRPAPSRSRWWRWLVLLAVPLLAAGALYAAWQAKLLPAGIDAMVTPWLGWAKGFADRAVAWLMALIATVRARLLPGAGLF